MKYNWFDKICSKYERYGIRNLMLFIALANAAVFAAGFFIENLYSLLVFDWPSVMRGEIWRLVTFVMVPPSSLFWLLTPLIIYFYYWMGRTLQTEWGRLKFTIYYLTGMLMTIIAGIISGRPMDGNDLNMSLFLAMAALFPDMPIRLYFMISVKMKWLALIDLIFITFTVISQRSLLPLVPLLNFALYFWRDIVRYARGQARRSNNTVQFKTEVRKAKRVQGYLHKCVVCGKTDTENPETEFRYCSLCSGYECYCAEHIRDHTHR